MKREIINQKKKLTTNTYMREALNYETIIIKENNDYFVTIKKYNELTCDFTYIDELGNNVTLITKGSFIVEITPLNENYNIRFYVSKEKKLIEMYIDITLYNGEEKHQPYYIDLYLDIIRNPKTNFYKFDDEDELLDAYNNKLISKKDYDLAYEVGNKLLNDLKNNTNKYINIDIIELINRYYR